MLAEREAGRNSGRRQRLRTRGEEWVLLISLQTGLELGQEGDSHEERGNKRDNSGLQGQGSPCTGTMDEQILGGSTCKAGLACVKASSSGALWKTTRSPVVAEPCGG